MSVAAGVFLAGCGMIGALVACTAPKWGERIVCGAASLGLIMGGIALLAL